MHQTQSPHAKRLILVFPFGYLSHYLRCIVLAKRLSVHFELRFAAHQEYNHFVLAAGFATFPCDAHDEAAVLQQAKSFDFSWMNDASLSRILNAQVEAIKAYRPCAVLGDAVPGLKMAAELTGVSFISVFNGYMSKYYAGERSISKTHPMYSIVRLFPVALKARVTRWGESLAMKGVHRPFKRLRASRSLPAKSTFLDEFEGDLNLICDLPALFPQKALPPNYRMIGPLVYDSDTPTGLVQKPDRNRKTIFVSMGSTGDWHSVHWLNNPAFSPYNIIAAGDKSRVLSAANILHHDFVSAAEILPHTDLVICQGGNGTIYQALSYGVPLLCRTAHFEQEWNIAALEKSGLGRSLDGIDDVAKLNSIIRDWIERKGTQAYSEIQNSISESTASIEGRLADWLYATDLVNPLFF